LGGCQDSSRDRWQESPYKRCPSRVIDGGHGHGARVSWFLIGGDLYTAHTVIAVPALVYAVGAYGARLPCPECRWRPEFFALWFGL